MVITTSLSTPCCTLHESSYQLQLVHEGEFEDWGLHNEIWACVPMPSRTCCMLTSHLHLQPVLKSIKFSLTWHLHHSTRHLRVWSYSIMVSSLPSKPLLFKGHCGVMSSPIIHS